LPVEYAKPIKHTLKSVVTRGKKCLTTHDTLIVNRVHQMFFGMLKPGISREIVLEELLDGFGPFLTLYLWQMREHNACCSLENRLQPFTKSLDTEPALIYAQELCIRGFHPPMEHHQVVHID